MKLQNYEIRFITPEHGLFAMRFGEHLPVPARGDWVCFEDNKNLWVVEHRRFEYMRYDVPVAIVTCWLSPAPEMPTKTGSAYRVG